VILAIGVRPETALAKMAGIEIGQRGGIRVDEQMRTSDPDIFAVGDAVEVKDFVTGQWSLVALAGPANRQGRIAADVIAGRDSRFRGTQGTSIWPVSSGGRLDRRQREDAATAWRPRTTRRSTSTRTRTRATTRAPKLAMKVLFRKSDGRLLGAQALGEDGVDKRIDSFAMAIQMGATVYDLEEPSCATRRPSAAPRIRSTSRAWSRPMSSAATCRSATGNSVDGGFLLDVRNPAELAVESVPGAVNIPLPQLRARLGELPRDREILVICRSGQRAYYATRILLQNGFKAETSPAACLTQSESAGKRETVYYTKLGSVPGLSPPAMSTRNWAGPARSTRRSA
jgi:rhodanese-related sulfurtransferase